MIKWEKDHSKGKRSMTSNHQTQPQYKKRRQRKRHHMDTNDPASADHTIIRARSSRYERKVAAFTKLWTQMDLYVTKNILYEWAYNTNSVLFIIGWA
ncbi:3977_t:CDS:2 [Rhizophagus irregularis]|nr:3977_t:CDS:2 [Rhizophagus irregularis]